MTPAMQPNPHPMTPAEIERGTNLRGVSDELAALVEAAKAGHRDV